ncbi:histone-fold-containing protein [Pseudovirgaria hyperparasitica]|uniref:DNA polymerase epsilon subunit D n=1 Tax=Pseudovirgaria hyperparasitica TaxID=470096 RepID=A0A6A6WGB8_9PEZI|nr:histone-fold-containing protein [Pseudovirgaria hyperparasitica]KAF2761823.1 histone-fold-containing protein [Pseudovirgaria hyperparasitica]
MPPRKSNASTVPDEGNSSMVDGISIDDLGLPKSMVQRLARGALPPNTVVQKDAILAIQKSATVFISYLASHANELTMRSNKKTIQPQDVLNALHAIEFERFAARLDEEHTKFATIQTEKRNSYRRKVKEEKIAAAQRFADENITAQQAPSSPAEESFVTAEGSVKGLRSPARRKDGDSPPAHKKARREDGAEPETDAEMEDEVDDQDDEEDDEEDEEEEEDEPDDDEEDHGDGADQLVEDPLEDNEERDEDSEGEDSD